jgi:hypothetical protein
MSALFEAVDQYPDGNQARLSVNNGNLIIRYKVITTTSAGVKFLYQVIGSRLLIGGIRYGPLHARG